MSEDYESIGVTLTMERSGKFTAKRVFLNDGKIAYEEVLSQGRALQHAHKEASKTLALLVSDFQRRNIAFKTPKQLKLKLNVKE